uniref:Uncharacterized protein n=1 Tax=Leptobrachium leishanense TaxID=445787 RepID=A0A8C5WIU5_9ANUR
MASAALRDQLTCSICTDIYTDPVTLTCGHTYCRLCITRTWDNQEERESSCPECRHRFRARPKLRRNLSLTNIAESFRSSHPEQEEVRIPCTYCDSPVPAAKTCLHCEVLEYYCCEESVFICVSCSLAGEHRGHRVETLNEASEKKIKKLRNILQKLTSQREEAEKSVQSLEELRRQVQEKAAWITERVTALIRDIRKQLEALEKGVLSEISRHEEQVSLRVSDLIRQLEIKKEELSRKMSDIEELCNKTDTVTVLQEKESDRDDYCDAEEDTEKCDIKVHDVGDLDVGLISVTLYSSLAGIVTGVKRWCHVPGVSDMLLGVNTAPDMVLDVNTAGNHVSVSEDLKTTFWSEMSIRRPDTPERFQDYAQVLSSRSFSSGRHYWEVEGSESGEWRVGMAYPSIARRREQSVIGYNKKSWGLWKREGNHCYVRHDSKVIQLPHPPSCLRFGIFLDYEAGRLSFYELCDPIRHLHTFTAAFTEPLHAVFAVYLEKACVRIEDIL